MASMHTNLDRHVVVPAWDLDDLTELARLASERLELLDPSLAMSLRGTAAEVRQRAVLEP